MTAKEAWQLHKEVAEDLYHGHFDYYSPYIKLGKELMETHPIVDTAITRLEELEKREVPMKPEKMHRNEYGNYGTCANCKKSVSLSHYCPHCGQKLDWSDEK